MDWLGAGGAGGASEFSISNLFVSTCKVPGILAPSGGRLLRGRPRGIPLLTGSGKLPQGCLSRAASCAGSVGASARGFDEQAGTGIGLGACLVAALAGGVGVGDQADRLGGSALDTAPGKLEIGMSSRCRARM